MASISGYLILGITPFEQPDVQLAAALCKAGALGVLDLGRDPARAQAALLELSRLAPGGFGVRLPPGVLASAEALPAACTVVLAGAGTPIQPLRPRQVLIQVTCIEEARAAVASGADGLVAKGNESGGAIGEESSLVLLQRLAAELPRISIWVQGGIGLHGVAACLAGGATGVVLDSQLALLRESSVPAATRAALAAMDGSETAVVGGQRFFARAGVALPPPGSSAGEVAARFSADLASGLVPAGQDAAFARSLADRFPSAGALVRGLTAAAGAHLRQARALQPLAPGSRLAAQHSLRFPIAQGPMTRVSDRASFALAVAEGGGLPFLALSLLRGGEVRKLLTETAALLGKRPWGVGILGFVPAELREEQLEVIREVRPPVALIAGGRPAQARPLEELGIATYLHVPSPGLLDLFLKDGARRFVFEGRECGGHVGPRGSLVLWESAIERLVADGAPPDVSLLFAGGIHDARSAAMVAAMAAPLAARGAKLGVVLGTAYLFTEEAVSSGAILPGFQEEALRCDRTVLLETAPGHSTRCAETDFVRAFREERARLEAAGKTPQELWAELEQLNLGRLRIAAKGLRREGDALHEVAPAEQHREGMYMIGQVASLRGAVTTIAELHRDVSAGSVARLEALAPRDEAPTAPGADVAIVGMACLFPGSDDLQGFWRSIVGGENAITEVPKERWSPELYFDPRGTPGDTTPSKWGGFLSDVAFEPGAWGIPPRSLAAIEPVQLLALEVARKALQDAGYDGPGSRDLDRERTSVIFGAEAGTDLATAYGFRASYRQFQGQLPEALDAHLPRLTEDSFAGVLANVIAGRIANRLDLGGVNYTVDAACASSLAALDLAVKELTAGTSDAVLCGGADLHNSIQDYLLFSSVHALSPSGQCRTFDTTADGIVLGEGVACLLLKRRADAEAAGDRIYAVIRAVAGSSDGKSLGLTAPRKEGQVRALDRAYRAAGITPAAVGLVEAHGTGTVVGDRTELATLTEVFGAAGASPGSCALGSVKSQIGHTKCAAGLAGLIKAALSIHHHVLPPTINLQRPSPYWDPALSPFVFQQEARPWSAPVRRAGISAFGFGGTNFHAVLEGSGQAPASGLPEWPAELFLFRGADRAAALATAAKLLALLEGPARKLRDLARSTAAAGQGSVQVAIVASSVAELATRLRAAAAGQPSKDGVFLADGAPAGAVALLFPGQGSQRPGMLAELFVVFPALQRHLVRGAAFTALLHPPTAFTPEQRAAQKAALTDTRAAQPALGIVDLAAAELLASFGVVPAMVGGHSYGELPALVIAGALPEEELLALSSERARCILEAAAGAPGTMAAVRAGTAQVTRVLDGLAGVVVANQNAPDQVVIAGPDAAVEAACEKLAAAGLSARRIPVACAFHSPVVAGARVTFASRLAAVNVRAPRLPVYSNVTASPYAAEPAAIREALAAQLASPVRFAEQIEAMWAAGARIFVEAGPGEVLTDLTGRILGDRPHLAVALDRGDGGIAGLLLALGRLATAGVPILAEALFTGRDAKCFDLAAPPAHGPSATAWMVNGHLARPLHGEPPEFALRPVTGPLPGPQARGPGAGDAREDAVRDYLHGMRELVEGQRQVMLRFLGQEPTERSLGIQPLRANVVVEAGRQLEAPPVVAALPVRSAVEELTAIVSERTGYPVEMLDPDLDLEADLGIDSIKRIEILGTLAERLGIGPSGGGARSELIEPLAAVKTLRAIAAWLETRSLGGSQEDGAARAVVAVEATRALEPHRAGQAEAAQAGAAQAGSSQAGSAHAGSAHAGSARTGPSPAAAPLPELGPVERYLLAVEPIAAAVPNGVTVSGRSFALTDDGRVAPALAALLTAGGAKARLVRPGEPLGKIDGLLHLAPLARPERPAAAAEAFALAKEAALGGASWILAASGLGGAFGRGPRGGAGGLAGLLKSLAKELPEVRVRVVDLDPAEEPARLASQLHAELLADDRLVEVGYLGGVRQALQVVRGGNVASGGGRRAPELGPSSVVLITGGARGITARVAVELATRYRCKLELVGRSPLPEGEEAPDLAAAADAPAIRRVLLGRGEREPAVIEATCGKLLAAREIRATLAAIRATGATVRYQAVDVRDPAATAALLDGIYASHSRLDGVIHGAGILEDKLLRDKTDESFRRVFETKVNAAVTLGEKLRDDVGFLVFFSSVSGAFGNRGQLDYSAANDALDKLAWRLRQRLGNKVVSINWGPWGGGGMVSEELTREYARRGIGLIPPEEGVARLFDELTLGTEAQVILMRATPESLQ